MYAEKKVSCNENGIKERVKKNRLLGHVPLGGYSGQKNEKVYFLDVDKHLI